MSFFFGGNDNAAPVLVNVIASDLCRVEVSVLTAEVLLLLLVVVVVGNSVAGWSVA